MKMLNKVRGRRLERGMTLIEILVAVVVSAVGFAAVFSLQIGTMQGNISARDTQSAVNLAESAVETLKRDAYMWSLGAPVGFYPADRVDSQWLTAAPGSWHTMTPSPVDHNGEGRAGAAGVAVGSPFARQRFCVHYWLQPATGAYEGLITARVRVIWPRASLDPGDLERAGLCADATRYDALADKVGRFYSITLPATIRRHPVM